MGGRAARAVGRRSGKRPHVRPGGSFAAVLQDLVPALPKAAAGETLKGAVLAHLEYPRELEVKNRGIAGFWSRHRLQGRPEPLVAAPRPRNYRTTSKRRAILKGPSLFLVLADHPTRRLPGRVFLRSPLEPEGHEAIYRFLQRTLSEGQFRLPAGQMNHLIIRGTYREQVVIFNVRTMNGPLVRKLKILAGRLKEQVEAVAAAFVFLDPSSSDYYLESRRPRESVRFKKLFGPDYLSVRQAGIRYDFPPLAFSQVNEAMVPKLLETARELLAPAGEERLLDLYCGYGLFSHFMAGDCHKILGIDAEGPAIKAARSNCRLNQASRGAGFLAGRIDRRSLEKLLPNPAGPEVILLDPPRHGPKPGVIGVLARRRPGRVLHVFCGVDQIPDSLGQWRDNGYEVERVVPLDMFPGTAGLEVMVLLVRGRDGRG